MYRKSTRHRLALAALLAATATVVTMDFRENTGGPLHRAQDMAISVVAPLQDGIGQVFGPVGDFLSDLGNIGDLKEENARLSTELERMTAQQRRLPEILRENERLKELVAANDQDWTQGRTLAVQVIGNGPSNYEWTAFINKGSADGIRENMAVVSAQGLVGRTFFVSEKYSKVLLLIDPQHSVGARLTGSGETGVASGRSLEDLRMDLISPDVEIKDGETVVTSGFDRGIFPGGIPIGRVTEVAKNADGLTKTARVEPVVNFTALDKLLVLLDSGPVEQPQP
ncbi:MAG TPA: rod shape-determining protein MreC [Actinomycetota bacterium]|nr:rod shape-determining protein MreC [Actinomycetota bacterium]